ncbi:MAG: GspH/FimT family pseudopilin [Arenicellales bacterium]
MRKNAGFTLIELMITLVVAALLLTWAVPSFERFIRRTDLTSATNDWVGVLNYARNEAITRGKRVTICRSVNPNACNGSTNCLCGTSQPAPANGVPNYHSGYLIFTSASNSLPLNFVAASDRLLRTGKAESNRVTIRGNAQANNAFSFMPDGTLDPNNVAGPATARQVICLADSPADLSASQNAKASDVSDTRAVIISAIGHSRISKLSGSSTCAGNAADSLAP